MSFEFTAHNIRLDNGAFTKPEKGISMEAYPSFISARRVLDTVFHGDKSGFRLADLGCLEGGYAVEFARMGFQVLGLEVRESNIAACDYVKANTNLPNLQFVKDDAWNVAKYGTFDAIFCRGLLYHLDRPKQFLQMVAGVAARLLILNTHFSETGAETAGLPRFLRLVFQPFLDRRKTSIQKFTLSSITENESLFGRWFTEFASDTAHRQRENSKWASWDNRRSFWIQREYLLQAIEDAGFDLVMEQFDGLAPNIADAMIRGNYKTDSRGTFIGIKTQDANIRPEQIDRAE